MLATALGIYGISSVSANHTTGDIGQEFINWISTKNLDEFWDKQTDIKTAQMAINAIYQMGLDGSINLAEWTYNEQNAINSCFGELLQLWAADNFGLNVSSYETVYIGDFAINTFYSSETANSVAGTSFGDGGRPFGATSVSNDGSLAMYTNRSSSSPTIVTSSVDSGWSYTYGNSNNLGNQSVSINWPMNYYNSSTGSIVNSSYINSNYADLSSIALNTYYSLSLYVVDYDLIPIVAFNPAHNDRYTAAGNTLVATYNSATQTWSTYGSWANESISVAAPDELTYNPWDDSPTQGINDLLSHQIPLGADYVYNPSLQALEQQGSVPVILDWSRVADWADILERIRAGTLDGSQVIDNTTTGVRADTISDTIVEGEAIQDWPSRSWETPSQEIGTIGAALNFTGETIGEKFPFSTWGDVVAISNILAVDAVAPEFDMPVIGFDGSGFTVERVHISLAGFEGVAIVIRLMFLILMILGVIWLAVRQLKAFQGV